MEDEKWDKNWKVVSLFKDMSWRDKAIERRQKHGKKLKELEDKYLYRLDPFVKGEIIKYLLLDIQTVHGSAINPIIMGHYIYDHLQRTAPSRNNKEHARNYAYVFACLCNEWRLVYNQYKLDKFFMCADKWDKYLLGETIIRNASKVLADMGLITYSQGILKPKWRVTYDINTKKLYEIRNHVFNIKTSTKRKLDNDIVELEKIKIACAERQGKINQDQAYEQLRKAENLQFEHEQKTSERKYFLNEDICSEWYRYCDAMENGKSYIEKPIDMAQYSYANYYGNDDEDVAF